MSCTPECQQEPTLQQVMTWFPSLVHCQFHLDHHQRNMSQTRYPTHVTSGPKCIQEGLCRYSELSHHVIGRVVLQCWCREACIDAVCILCAHAYTCKHTLVLVLVLVFITARNWPCGPHNFWGCASRRQQDWWHRWLWGHQPHLPSCMASSVQ